MLILILASLGIILGASLAGAYVGLEIDEKSRILGAVAGLIISAQLVFAFWVCYVVFHFISKWW